MRFAGYETDDKHDYYDRIHSTWVCTQALRDRDLKVNEDCAHVASLHQLDHQDFLALQARVQARLVNAVCVRSLLCRQSLQSFPERR